MDPGDQTRVIRLSGKPLPVEPFIDPMSCFMYSIHVPIPSSQQKLLLYKVSIELFYFVFHSLSKGFIVCQKS